MTFKKSNLMKWAKEKILIVTFTKVNGDERVMKCTLNPKFLPEMGGLPTKAQNKDVMPVWDLEALDWRSFRIDSIKDVSFVP